MKWVASGITDRGLRRRTNEDTFRIRPDVGLFLVADGMGGHAAGEVASEMAANLVEREAASALACTESGNGICDALDTALQHAHEAIRLRAEREPDKEGMGTTLTALALCAGGCTYRIAHVGDSRAYLLRDGAFVQLTTDHTWVQRQIDIGRLTTVEARTHPFSSILMRAVGTDRGNAEVDRLEGVVAPGDLFLLCTDGLSGMVHDTDLKAILSRPLPLETLTAQLVEAANARGGQDNITAVLIRVST